MAIILNDAAYQYYEVDDTPVTQYPLTLACWAVTDNTDLAETMMGLADKDQPYDRYMLWLANRTGDPVEIYKSTVGGGDYAVTTTGVTADQPFHACGVIGAIDDLRVFINGGSKGVAGGSRTPSGINRTSIGRLGDSTPSCYWSGKIWEAAIWNAALTDEEVAILAKGFSPLFVRPQNLVCYWPLLGGTYPGVGGAPIDKVGGYNFTNTSGVPTPAVHGRIIYPSGIFVPSIESEIAAGIVRPLVGGSLVAGRKGLVA